MGIIRGLFGESAKLPQYRHGVMRSISGLSSSMAVAAIIVALVVGVLAGYGVGSTALQPVTETVTREVTTTVEAMMTTTVTMMEEPMMMETIPSVVVPNQAVESDTITVKTVYLDKPGYVVIHIVTLEGKPGMVVGHSELLQEGVHQDVRISLQNYQGRGELYAMLHYDDGDGVYSFPGPDKPVVKNNAIVQTLFKITNEMPSIAVSDQEIKNGLVVIDGLFLDKPGFVAIHLVTEEGKPGPVIGNSGLLVGQNIRVPIRVEGYEGQEELIAMLHYDNGDGVYEFPGPDGPVKLDDKVVLAKFKISGM